MDKLKTEEIQKIKEMLNDKKNPLRGINRFYLVSYLNSLEGEDASKSPIK